VRPATTVALALVLILGLLINTSGTAYAAGAGGGGSSTLWRAVSGALVVWLVLAFAQAGVRSMQPRVVDSGGQLLSTVIGAVGFGAFVAVLGLDVRLQLLALAFAIGSAAGAGLSALGGHQEIEGRFMVRGSGWSLVPWVASVAGATAGIVVRSPDMIALGLLGSAASIGAGLGQFLYMWSLASPEPLAYASALGGGAATGAIAVGEIDDARPEGALLPAVSEASPDAAPSSDRRKRRRRSIIAAVAVAGIVFVVPWTDQQKSASGQDALSSMGVEVTLPEGWKTRGVSGVFLASPSTKGLDAAQSLISGATPAEIEAKLASCDACDAPVMVIEHVGDTPASGTISSGVGATGSQPSSAASVIEGPAPITVGGLSGSTITVREGGRIERSVFVNAGVGTARVIRIFLPESQWEVYRPVIETVLVSIQITGTGNAAQSAAGNPPPPSSTTPVPLPSATRAPPPPPPPSATPPPSPTPLVSFGREALSPGWDIFNVALSSGSVSWTAGPGSLSVTFQLTGAPPNGTFTGGAHFFPTNPPQCPFESNFNAGTHPGTTCAGSREGVTTSVDGWDFGVIHTDASGSATVQFNLSPHAGTYRTQFTVRFGNPCPPNCGVVYRSGGRFATTFAVVAIP
jgi:hypothetical protein